MHQQAWPKYDPALIIDVMITLPIQINGKLRGRIVVSVEATETDVTQQALAAPDVQRYLSDKRIVNMVYVPGLLVNIVVV